MIFISQWIGMLDSMQKVIFNVFELESPFEIPAFKQHLCLILNIIMHVDSENLITVNSDGIDYTPSGFIFISKGSF